MRDSYTQTGAALVVRLVEIRVVLRQLASAGRALEDWVRRHPVPRRRSTSVASQASSGNFSDIDSASARLIASLALASAEEESSPHDPADGHSAPGSLRVNLSSTDSTTAQTASSAADSLHVNLSSIGSTTAQRMPSMPEGSTASETGQRAPAYL